MEAKKAKKQNFFRRNLYYFVVAFVLLAAVSVSVALLVAGKSPVQTVDKPSSGTSAGDGSGGSSIKPDKPDDNPKPDKPDDKPTEKPVTFTVPVSGATVIQDYTAASVAYNPTLNIYTGHLAIDFAADEGTDVCVVYDGVIESVTTSYLTGTTVTVKHENGLKTLYNSIEADETLAQGKTVKQGDVIGKVSMNNKQEYKSGPHLHFEVYENDKKIDPGKYLSITQK